ncbi:MAG: endonuclease/exonuclease/phosphatase family protein, partial [Bacteroidota bacterium]
MKKVKNLIILSLFPIFLLFFGGYTLHASPALKLADSISSDLPIQVDQLKILSWNIGFLPFEDLIQDVVGRARGVAAAISQKEYDIVLFEEAFNITARSIIKKDLQTKYPYVYGPINKSSLSPKFNSGLWILSKIPLEILRSIVFSDFAGFDGFARKGAVLLNGEFQGHEFQILATHLQDDEYPQEIREEQLKEIEEKLILPYNDPTVPQIICGDFNTNQNNIHDYQRLLG